VISGLHTAMKFETNKAQLLAHLNTARSSKLGVSFISANDFELLTVLRS
jgi:hypothetical protein